MRSELSKKNPFWLPKERYLELKHYAKTYWDDKTELGLPEPGVHYTMVTAAERTRYYDTSSTEQFVLKRAQMKDKVEKIEKAAFMVGGDIFGPFILWCIEGYSYDVINAQCLIACGRRQFYQMYRQFFWVLDKLLMGNADTQKT